jgi:hypothetical protein
MSISLCRGVKLAFKFAGATAGGTAAGGCFAGAGFWGKVGITQKIAAKSMRVIRAREEALIFMTTLLRNNS